MNIISTEMVMQWLIGFLLQIAVVTFYCLFPFRGHFRYSDSKVGIIASVVILISTLIFGIVVFWAYYIDTGLREYYRLVGTIVYYLIVVSFFFLYLYVVKEDTVYKVFIFLLVASFNTAFELIYRSITVSNNIEYELGFGLYPPLWTVCWIAFNCLIGYSFIKLIKIIIGYINIGISKRIWYSMNYLVLIVLMLLLIFYNLPFQANLNSDIIISVFLSFVSLGMFLLYYWIFRTIIIERNNILKQDKLEMTLQIYKQNDQHLKEIREIRHELKHHLNALSLYLNNGDQEGARQYLNKLIVSEEAQLKSFTPQNLFNLLLSDYYQRFLKNDVDVDFDIAVFNKLNIEDFDLIELFTNLFDNAMEAMQRDQNESRYKLQVKQNGNFLTIISENTFDKSLLNRDNNKLLTTKENSALESHGHGVDIMKQIANKYNGHLTYDASEDQFKMMINLCLAPE